MKAKAYVLKMGQLLTYTFEDNGSPRMHYKTLIINSSGYRFADDGAICVMLG